MEQRRAAPGEPPIRGLAALLDAAAPAPDALAALLRGTAGRLDVPDVTDRDVWDRVPDKVRLPLLAAAAAELGRPAPRLLASQWARSFRDGVRTAYEDGARRLRERTTVLALAAVLTGESAPAHEPTDACPHLDAACDGLVLLAETTTWCWAPHDRGAQQRGEVIGDPGEPFLDLGAAETALLYAWADHALGPHLDLRMPGLRRRLRDEVDRRVLSPFLRRRDWWWLALDTRADNWNPWIHGAVLTCALLFEDDEHRRAGIVRSVAAGLDRYLASLPDDGGIDEGVAYWWHGAARFLEALDLLAQAGGSALDAADLPVLPALLAYPQRMHLGDRWFVNTGDASARLPSDQPWHVLFRWARRLDRPDSAAFALDRARHGAAAVVPAAGLGRALASLADPAWLAAATADPEPAGPKPWLSSASWLPRTQVMVARENTGSTDGLTVAVKAGSNGEHHNHLDVGSYWVALDGIPVVVDLGQPTYTAHSFGPRRYEAWPLRSSWHNLPDLGPGQQPGGEYRARAVAVDGTALRADLAGAYPAGTVGRWVRTVRLERAAGGRAAHVVVEERWEDCTVPVLLRHVLHGQVECGEGLATVTTARGGTLRMRWDRTLATAAVEYRTLNDPLLQRSWGDRVVRLTLTLTHPDATGAFAVRWER
ncbi:heparinase [Kitasatospora phosalacinea]|uniref:heparinase n=1 Tax=Kitasatospora phosalacinea TaxID=2065 RepID=UPI000AEBDCFF|nr:heparinase [Kitasatospora phosalacinea]